MENAADVMTAARVSRASVEEFLIEEAALLDAWRLEEWANLFTEDGVYLIPPTDMPDADPGNVLFLVHDDRFRLTERAKRLLKPRAHAEHPRSRTQHTISNVRLDAVEGSTVRASCHFIVHRSRREILDVFPGISRYELVMIAGGFRIRSKRASLTLDALRPQGKLSIIL